MAGRALLHELGEHAGLVGGLPLLGELGHHPVPHGLARPEGDDLLFVDLPELRVGLERGLLPRVEDLEVLDAVAAQLGIGRRRLGRGPLLADDQLAVVDADRLVNQDVLESEGVLDGRGNAVRLRALVEFGDELGPLARHGRDGGQRLLAELLDSRGHGHPPMVAANPAPVKAFLISSIRAGARGSKILNASAWPRFLYFSRPPW